MVGVFITGVFVVGVSSCRPSLSWRFSLIGLITFQSRVCFYENEEIIFPIKILRVVGGWKNDEPADQPSLLPPRGPYYKH